MRKQFKFILIFLLPLLLKYIYLYFFIDFDLIHSEDFKEDMLFCLAIFSVFYSGIFKRQFYVDVVAFFYLLYFVLETTSYIAVSSNFSSSYMFLLIESSGGELKEFASSYLNIPIITFIILMISLFFIIRKTKFEINIKGRMVTACLFLVAIIVFLKLTGLIESNAYHNIVRGTYGYFDLQSDFKLNANIKKDDIKLLKNNDVLVVVLGESTTRDHMELYGYYRKNTPNLSAFKDSLYVYNDVISSDVFTLKAVPKMLTSLSNDSNNQENINIISIFNQAGYKTYWLSNQRPISYHDNAVSKIAATASFFKFYNHNIETDSSVLDEIIFSKFNLILKESGKKVIFLHLLGTHFDYSKRYPKNFAKYFNKTNSKKQVIKDEYDNAVLYNDFVVSSLLKSLRKQKGKNALIYISDHGENVYDDGDFLGHTESNLKKIMFDIPFIVWKSKNFELPDDFEYKPNRKFMADHLYESLGHLFGVKYKNMDFSNSIFSNKFKERKRIVVTGKNYDTFFKGKNE